MNISPINKFILLISTCLVWNQSFSQDNSGGTELKSIEEVIEGIDSLLGDIKNSSSESNSAPLVPTYPQSSSFDNLETQQGSFRVQDELMPNNLLNSNFPEPEPSILDEPLNLDDINPPLSRPNLNQSAPSVQPVRRTQAFSAPPQQIAQPMPHVDHRSAS